ncbi:hypothetical protein RCO48_24750 [Peribacillus frigoritolerans]|nr:hypothetical protein [Peribacillus frigoritolerans]
MIGTEGTRLLREKRVSGVTPQAKAEEAPRPPAESECLKWKSTFQFVQAIKIDKLDFHRVYLHLRPNQWIRPVLITPF